MRWAKVLAAAGLAGGVLAAGGAEAQETAPFPPALDRDTLLLWLQRQTDISPERVVAVTPQALTALVSVFPATGSDGPRVVIRAEALNAETYERAGALSWHVSISADCAGRRVRLGETTGYPNRNLLGERRVLREAETSWRTPGQGTALDAVWRAACDASYRGPFQSSTVSVAAAEPPPDAEPAAPETAAPPPPPAPPPKVAPAAPRRAAFGLAAQVGATPTEAETRRLLTGLSGPIAGRPTWVETAVVAGRTWRRAMVGGFADRADVERFCAEVKRRGGACLARKARPS